MTSQQPMLGVCSQQPPAAAEPFHHQRLSASERALNRSKIYLLISWSLLYPEDEEFLDYLRCGELVKEWPCCSQCIGSHLGTDDGGRAKEKLGALKQQFDQVESLIASEVQLAAERSSIGTCRRVS